MQRSLTIASLLKGNCRNLASLILEGKELNEYLLDAISLIRFQISVDKGT
jgi:hypothetical protein